MTFYDIYVGDPDDPQFQWEGGGNPQGNIPRVIINLGCAGSNQYIKARHVLLSSQYGGRELDWGACGALLEKARITAFIQDFTDDKQWIDDNVRKIRSLKDNKLYVVIASEL